MVDVACVECKIEIINPYYFFSIQRLVHALTPEMNCGLMMENPEEAILS